MYTMGSIEYLNPVGSIHYGEADAKEVALTQLLANLKSLQSNLKTPMGMGANMFAFADAIALESGKNTDNLDTYGNQVRNLGKEFTKDNVKQGADLIRRLQSKAKSYGAPKTASAIDSSARYYWNNVESKLNPPKKSSSGSSSSGSRPSSAPPAVTAPSGFQGFYEDYKMPIIIGGSVLGLGEIILIARSIMK